MHVYTEFVRGGHATAKTLTASDFTGVRYDGTATLVIWDEVPAPPPPPADRDTPKPKRERGAVTLAGARKGSREYRRRKLGRE